MLITTSRTLLQTSSNRPLAVLRAVSSNPTNLLDLRRRSICCYVVHACDTLLRAPISGQRGTMIEACAELEYERYEVDVWYIIVPHMLCTSCLQCRVDRGSSDDVRLSLSQSALRNYIFLQSDKPGDVQLYARRVPGPLTATSSAHLALSLRSSRWL